MCEKVCPMNVIHMKQKKDGKKPSWGKGCVQCNACINVCPKKAIDYFGAREKQVWYFHPEYRKVILQQKNRDCIFREFSAYFSYTILLYVCTLENCDQ